MAEITNLLLQLSRIYPGLRFGQLIGNMLGVSVTQADLYYMTDADVASRLRDYARCNLRDYLRTPHES